MLFMGRLTHMQLEWTPKRWGLNMHTSSQVNWAFILWHSEDISECGMQTNLLIIKSMLICFILYVLLMKTAPSTVALTITPSLFISCQVSIYSRCSDRARQWLSIFFPYKQSDQIIHCDTKIQENHSNTEALEKMYVSKVALCFSKNWRNYLPPWNSYVLFLKWCYLIYVT